MMRRLLQSRSSISRLRSINETRSHLSTLPTTQPSLDLIPDYFKEDVPALVRQVGSTRRFFLLDPYFDAAELESLAYRIRILTKNDGLSSILIATDQTDPTTHGALPGSLLLRDGVIDDPYFGSIPAFPDHTYHVSGGYDPLAIYQDKKYKDKQYCQDLLHNLGDLALALRGEAQSTRIPTIAALHGALTDGGAVFLNSTYVLATPETRLMIANPSKGLSLDPVGLSYYLPRLGEEFKQPSARFNAGILLACFGYEANAEDLMETGLATHFTDSVNTISMLETTLSQLRPWNQQGLLKRPKRSYGDQEPRDDHNASFRNVTVSATLDCHSVYRADHCDVWANNSHEEYGDPSLEPDYLSMIADRSSELVNWAATFDEILKEKSLVRMLDALREVAKTETTDPDEQEARDMAGLLVKRLESQSPLAVSVVFALLEKGANKLESLKSCIQRERRVQQKLLAMDDFERWAKHKSMKADDAEAEFSSWKHKTLSDVPKDLVEEILEAEKEAE